MAAGLGLGRLMPGMDDALAKIEAGESPCRSHSACS
ncbi:hypothetical protein SDIAM26S_00777 [Streptomyces diastaticus subsp. diastaticus]